MAHPADPEDDGLSSAAGLPSISDLLGLERPSNGTVETFDANDLMTEFGITIETLQFYTRQGFLHPELRGGSWLYSRRDRHRLLIALLARAVHFTISEAITIAGAYD